MDGTIPIMPGNGFAGGSIDLHNHTINMRQPDGQLVTMDLGTSDVHIDAALANYISGYKPADFCADIGAPPVPVNKASNYYFQFDPDNALATVDGTQVAPGADAPVINPKLSNTRYSTLGYSLACVFPTEVLANQDAPLNLQMAGMRMVMDKLLLNREVRVKNVLFSSTNFTGSHIVDLSGTPAAKWNGGASSDPVANIQSLMQSSLMPITDMIMDLTTWNAFTTNATVQKYVAFKSAAPPLPGTDQADLFAALLRLPKPHICEVRAKNATTGAYPYVWSGDVALVRRPPGEVSDVDIATAKTFRWNGAEGQLPDQNRIVSASGGGFTVRSFFNPYKGGRGVTVIIVTHNDAEQLITGLVGGYIKGAVQ